RSRSASSACLLGLRPLQPFSRDCLPSAYPWFALCSRKLDGRAGVATSTATSQLADNVVVRRRAVAISQTPRDLGASRHARARFVRALRGGMYVAGATRPD